MNVYDRYNRDAKIKRIYFYTVNSDHGLTEYFIRSTSHVAWSEMPRLIDEIAAEIADGSIPPTNSRQHHRVWKKRSYFVYYDSTGQLKEDNAVVFTSEHTSFMDGADVPGVRGIHAFYCINHMRKGIQDQQPGDTQHVTVMVNHAHRAGAEDEREESAGAAGNRSGRPLLTHNDSGTNTGPP